MIVLAIWLTLVVLAAIGIGIWRAYEESFFDGIMSFIATLFIGGVLTGLFILLEWVWRVATS